MSLRPRPSQPHPAGRLDFVLRAGTQEVGCGGYNPVSGGSVSGCEIVSVDSNNSYESFMYPGIKGGIYERGMVPTPKPPSSLSLTLACGTKKEVHQVLISRLGDSVLFHFMHHGANMSTIKCKLRQKMRGTLVYDATYTSGVLARVGPPDLLYKYLQQGCAHAASNWG